MFAKVGLLAVQLTGLEKHPDAQNEEGGDDNVVARGDATESIEFSNEAAAAEKHEADATPVQWTRKGGFALGANAAVVKEGNAERAESGD